MYLNISTPVPYPVHRDLKRGQTQKVRDGFWLLRKMIGGVVGLLMAGAIMPFKAAAIFLNFSASCSLLLICCRHSRFRAFATAMAHVW